MSIAICISCGHVKKKPIEVCPSCGFSPTSSEEKAKSIILSTRYDIDDDYLGKSKEELLAIGPLVAAGKYRFDEREVRALARYGEHVMATPARVLLLDLVKWIALPALLLIGLFTLLWLTGGNRGEWR